MLTIGTELLIGDTINTNAASLGKLLINKGLKLNHELCVRDSKEDIESALDFLIKYNSAIIISGGLGPTEDDITKNSLSLITGIPLIEDTVHIENMKKLWKKRGYEMSKLNIKQALIFENFNKIKNTIGTALGCHFIYKDTDIYVLPGPPREFIPMVNDYVLPSLISKNDAESVVYKYVSLYGIPESTLADKITEFKPDNLDLAFLPSKGVVKIRYDASKISSQDERLFLDNISENFKNNVINYSNESIIETLSNELKLKSKSVSFIESITGGSLASSITSYPGATKIFKQAHIMYQDSSKKSYLDSESLESDWKVLSKRLMEEFMHKSSSDIYLVVLGEAGPISSSNNKVGTVLVVVSDGNNVQLTEHYFTGDRKYIIKRTVNQCFFELLKIIR